MFVEPVDGWDPSVAKELSGPDEVVYRARLVGADPALVREGGGNFSGKGVATDHLGRQVRVMWMSAWGCDGATCDSAQFPVLRLDDLRALWRAGPVDEAAMVAYLVSCGLRGEQPRPGIETLTHAFIDAAHVDHTHPDAVIALTSIPDGRELADEAFGAEAIWFDYRQFDVDVARELGDRIAAQPRCRFVLMANHGLLTWADTAEQCYRNSHEAVRRATEALAARVRQPMDLGGPVTAEVPAEVADRLLTTVLPVVRGVTAPDGYGVLRVDRSADAVGFSCSRLGPQASLRGPACPDHLVTVGYRPLVVAAGLAGVDNPVAVMDEAIAGHRRWQQDYYDRHATTDTTMPPRGDAPRVVVLPGIGVVGAGSEAAKARLSTDHFGQTMAVVRVAEAAGGYVTLTEAQGFADEYWPLMRLKPQLRPPLGALAGTIVLVAGAGPVPAELARRLAALDAHVALAGPHRDTAQAAAAIVAGYGEGRAVALAADPADPAATVEAAVLAYGGFDVLVQVTAGAGTALARAALPVFARQGLGGTVVLAAWEDPRAAVDELASVAAGYEVSVNGVVLDADPWAAATGTAHAGAELAGVVAFLAGTGARRWTGNVLGSRPTEDRPELDESTVDIYGVPEPTVDGSAAKEPAAGGSAVDGGRLPAGGVRTAAGGAW